MSGSAASEDSTAGNSLSTFSAPSAGPAWGTGSMASTGAAGCTSPGSAGTVGDAGVQISP